MKLRPVDIFLKSGKNTAVENCFACLLISLVGTFFYYEYFFEIRIAIHGIFTWLIAAAMLLLWTKCALICGRDRKFGFAIFAFAYWGFPYMYIIYYSGRDNLRGYNKWLAMTNRIVERFKEMGGELHTNAPVKRIIAENGTAKGIELENGEKITADEIISAVDTNLLFGKFLDRSYTPKEWREAYDKSADYPVMSGFQVAFVTEGAPGAEGTVFFSCDPIKIGRRSFDMISVKNYGYDKSFAPEGKTVIQTNISQYDEDYLYWKSLSKEEYKAKKQELAAEIEERIIKEFPELDGRIGLLDCWTPLTYERYCGAYHGAYMAFITKPGVKQLKCSGTVKGVKNLYIAGQWIMSPGGLPVAAASGKFAVQRILKKDKRPIEI